MEEQLISFETAKLAKEKGFDFIYIIDNELTNHSLITQSLLQKWLREKYDIHIEILNHNNNLYYGDLIYDDAHYDYDDETVKNDAENCKTYEKALEICLYKALKLIK
jgi:hypothetical protein